MHTTLHADVLIIGGGIAGLWTLVRLKRAGFECVLVESKALGGVQTIASQGIIHGGLKYALDGQVGGAAAAIAAMPEVWRACLAGQKEAPVDLRGVRVLSEHYYYWTSPGVLSRIAGAGASKVMRTAVERVPPEARPELLRNVPTGITGVDVYRVGEMVLDSRLLVQKLAEYGRGRIVHGSVAAGGGELQREGAAIRARCADGREIEVRTQAIVLAAGAGNDDLARESGVREATHVKMQLRPLHMVMMRGAPGEPLFGHCVGTSSWPPLTITSGTMGASDERVWYIGGQIAETGVGREPAEQIAATKREIAECMPWVSLPESARWGTLRVDRAEGVPEGTGILGGMRPDLPVVVGAGRVIAAWPTKLAFAPLLGDEIVGMLARMKVAPKSDGSLDPVMAPPPVAPHVWDREDIAWS